VEPDAIVVEQTKGRVLLGFICADGEEGVWDYRRSDA
jgi:hypothetical protein